jgi:hypothetical protein
MPRFHPAILLVLLVAALMAGEGRDLTFLLVSDVHVGMAYKDCEPPLTAADFEQHITRTLDAIAAIPGRPWPATGPFAGLPAATVAKPKGLIVAGDLTESGTAAQWKDFDRLFPLAGRDPDRFPAFACVGNHDGGSTAGKVRNGMRIRNRALVALEPSLVLSDDGLHTAWIWQGVTFINVNLYPGTGPKEGGKPGSMWDPEDSLGFLRSRLTALPAPDAPVVIVMHFALDAAGWWDQGRRQTFYETIRDRNVVAILHGHTHRISRWEFPDAKDRTAFGGDGPIFDCFSAGAFKVEARKGVPFPGARNPCECYVFRLTDDRLMAAHWTGRDGGWNTGRDAAQLMTVKPLRPTVR